MGELKYFRSKRLKNEKFFVKWRRGWDSNPRYGCYPYNGLANRRLQPLGHPSTEKWVTAYAMLVLKIRAGGVNPCQERVVPHVWTAPVAQEVGYGRVSDLSCGSCGRWP